MSATKICKGIDCEKELHPVKGIRPCRDLCINCCAKERQNSNKSQLKRTPLNTGQKPIRSSKRPLKRSNTKKGSGFDRARWRRYIERKVHLDTLRGIPIACVETGVLIPHDNPALINGMCVSHVLAGSSNKKYYWLPDASVWMTPAVHEKWENGDRKSMRCYVELTKRQEWLKNLPDEYIKEREVT